MVPDGALSSGVILIKFLFRETTCYSFLRNPLKTTISRFTRETVYRMAFLRDAHLKLTREFMFGHNIIVESFILSPPQMARYPSELKYYSTVYNPTTTFVMQLECFFEILSVGFLRN